MRSLARTSLPRPWPRSPRPCPLSPELTGLCSQRGGSRPAFLVGWLVRVLVRGCGAMLTSAWPHGHVRTVAGRLPGRGCLRLCSSGPPAGP